MKNPVKSNVPKKLARGRQCFETWRRTHKPPTRLPEPLWSRAVELARKYGLSRTARTWRQIAWGWVLKRGRRTVTGVFHTLGDQADRLWTAYQKFFYRAAWSLNRFPCRYLGSYHLQSLASLSLTSNAIRANFPRKLKGNLPGFREFLFSGKC